MHFRALLSLPSSLPPTRFPPPPPAPPPPQVDAKDLQEVPTTSLIDGGFTVDSYFGNGTDIFTTIPLPLNSSLKKLSGVGRYDLVVPSIEFFQVQHELYILPL